MVLPKSTVHVSRFAGTALKSFTHGYAQTVVAASQSSYASQNTPVAPLASNFLSRLGKTNKSQHHHGIHTSVAPHESGVGATGKQDVVNHDSGLAQYYDAWHKYQNGDVKEWQQIHFAKRIGWKPPTTVPEAAAGSSEAEAVEVNVLEEAEEELPERAALKRAYSTSAVDNFAKAIDNKSAEAAALAQVNESIAEEIEKSKQEVGAPTISPSHEIDTSSVEDSSASLKSTSQEISSPESALTRRTTPTDLSASSPLFDIDPYTVELDRLAKDGQYAQVPAVFEAMLRSGLDKPSQLAYRALLSSAIQLTPDRHQQVPRVLEVYSDMLRRRVLPDSETIASLLDVLSARALDAAASVKGLDQKRLRYGVLGKFLFRSDELEYAILSEDQSLTIALKVLNSAPASLSLPASSYSQLIEACAQKGLLSEMLQLYQTMEQKAMVPATSIFPSMINAFGSAGDLHSVVECYDEYKNLAIANDSGMNDAARIDNDVYSALVKAYGTCNRLQGGEKFITLVEAEEPSDAKIQLLRDAVSLNALVPVNLASGNFERLSILANQMSAPVFARALNQIAIFAADSNNLEESHRALDALMSMGADVSESAMALLAMHIRRGDVEASEPFWRFIEASPAAPSQVEPLIMRASSLIDIGQAGRGLRQARAFFSRLREASQSSTTLSKRETTERIEEAVELLGRQVTSVAGPVHPEAGIELLRLMVDNGEIIAPLADRAIAAFGPEQIMHFIPADLDLLMQVQARMVLDDSVTDVAGPARFACLLENIVSRVILPDVATENLIEKTLINLDRSDLSRLWNGYRYPIVSAFAPAPYAVQAPFSPAVLPQQPAFEDSFDPYAARTDNKGSVAITDLLEKAQGRPAAILNEALAKFRNMRRAGRHPRFFAYAKLINAAAKESQLDVANDILEVAKQDVPFLPQYRVVRYGWISILDSMLAACLMTGRRDLAAKYHQDLLDMSAAPSANTYGLYITTLKENTKTFDEASEAVKIFQRAKTEGIEPTSFLYNALIGKLGKARRIDDCLFYFAEMRNLGIRPTSVTYGTIVNALCRVSDEKFAEEIFEEMEGCANYKPRPAPYHSLMQYFLTTKRDRSKVLSYYERMRSRGIEPTMHTYKLLIDAHATLEPVNMDAAELVIEQMKKAGEHPEAVHYSSLLHAKGCVLHDMAGARAMFDTIVSDRNIRLQPCVYQAMFESLVANHQIGESESLLADMRQRRVGMTPYIANALIHGWTLEKDLKKAQEAFNMVEKSKREPSTYESMVRAHMAVEDREGARVVVREALSRGYPSAVAGKIAELVGGGKL